MALDHVSTGDEHVSAHNEERDAINDLLTGAAGSISQPASPQLGQIIWYNGTTWTKSSVRYLEGNGTPEGSISAPIGSRYTQLDGSNGAIEFLKVTGTGNTGWMTTKGDTGWRNVLAQVTAGAAGADKFTANIRRINDLVQVFFDLETPNANGQWQPYQLPSGFRPRFNLQGGLTDNNEGAATTNTVNSNGDITMTTINGSKRDRWNGMWFTDNAWPSSLPGVAL